MTLPVVPAISASDVRALRGLAQRGGGPLSPLRSARLIEYGLAKVHPDYLGDEQRFCLTGKGKVWLHNRGKLPGVKKLSSP